MLISCRQGLYDGDYLSYLKGDLDQSCGSTKHFTAVMMIGIPTLLIWVVGMPLFIYIRLILSKEIKHHDVIRFRYGMLMQGYEDEYYHWESVIATRKMLIIGVSVFLSQFKVQIQSYIAIAIVVFFLTLQISANPYFRRDLDLMEKYSLATSLITLYIGLFFYITKQEEVQGSVLVILGSMLIVGINVMYLMYALWHIYLFNASRTGICGMVTFCVSAIPGMGMLTKCCRMIGLLHNKKKVVGKKNANKSKENANPNTLTQVMPVREAAATTLKQCDVSDDESDEDDDAPDPLIDLLMTADEEAETTDGANASKKNASANTSLTQVMPVREAATTKSKQQGGGAGVRNWGHATK